MHAVVRGTLSHWTNPVATSFSLSRAQQPHPPSRKRPPAVIATARRSSPRAATTSNRLGGRAESAGVDILQRLRPNPRLPRPRPAVAAVTALCVVTYTGAGLWADRYVGLPGQLGLGVLTWLAFLCATRPLAARGAPAGHARRRRRDDGRGRRLIDLGPLFVSAAQFAGVRAAGPRAGLRRGVSLAAAAASRPRFLVGAATAALEPGGSRASRFCPGPMSSVRSGASC